ncbi:CCA-adding enzyme [Candidatus Anstonella stagnisolia]|nr:CCA-adding enzyme [Candidatus Anstonella stagnisolia]
MESALRAAKVISKVLPLILPSVKERHEDAVAAEILMGRLRAIAPAEIEVALMGSAAKGTSLGGNRELDIFLLFPKKYEHDRMCSLGMEYAREAFKKERTEVKYAQHPYLHVFAGRYSADIVPAYKISRIEEKGSAVDRSQLHAHFIKSRMSADLRNDVLLLKKFLKTLGVYGAELRIEGFSGYLCELLVLHYGGFLPLLGAASSWHNPKLDIAEYYKGKEIPAFLQAPLIVIDPVDSNRNVAAVVSQTSLSRFVFEARRFLKSPSKSFFFKEKQSHSRGKIANIMKARKTHIIALRFAAPKVVDDILWPQLKKTSQCIVKSLQALDFEVFGYYHWSDGKECILLLELSRSQLPAIRRVSGPAVRFSQDCEKFLKAHKNALNLHIEHERLVAVEKRNLQGAEGALKEMLRTPVKIGIPENFIPLVKKSRILPPNSLLAKKYLEFAGDYFTRRVA